MSTFDDDSVFANLSEKMSEEFSNLGLYLNGPIQVHGTCLNEDIQKSLENGTLSEKDAVKNGLGDFFAMGEFSLNKMAWTQRILDPDGFAAQKEFAMIVPDDEEAKVAEARAILEGE